MRAASENGEVVDGMRHLKRNLRYIWVIAVGSAGVSINGSSHSLTFLKEIGIGVN